MSNLLIERYPVNAEFIGGEIKSSGIAFEDYSRMSTQLHKLSPNRRYDVPTWAVNDEQTCSVIARSMEGRAGLRMPAHEATDRERLQRAQQVLKTKEPQLVARLDGMCKRFVAAKNDGDVHAAALGIQIENLDTQLRILDRTAEMLGSIIYFYWRAGFTSVETGQQLGLKPPHVRMTILRLTETGVELGYGAPLPIQRRPSLKAVRAEAAAANEAQRADIIRLRKAGKFTVDIAKELGLGTNGSEIVNRVLIQAGLR
jgi:hypothetical protein